MIEDSNYSVTDKNQHSIRRIFEYNSNIFIIFLSAIVPYFVTVILTYHGVTEEGLANTDLDGSEEAAAAPGTDEAGSGVDLELNVKINFYIQF